MADTGVTELLGVYHAEGSLLGELRYVVGKLAGRTHCSLCDITHSGVRRRPELGPLLDELPVPMRFVHLDERPPEVVALTDGATPCVLARSGDGWRVLLGPAALEACRSRPEALVQAVRAALDGGGPAL